MIEDYIVSIGSVNVDSNLYVKEILQSDDEGRINELEVSSGGSAGNIASGISRLGFKSIFFGNIGVDTGTEMLIRDFNLDGVDVSYVKKTKKPNNSCFSIVNDEGLRTMYSFNNVDFSFRDFPNEIYSEKCKFMIFTSLTDFKILKDYIKIANEGKKFGTKIVFVPGKIFTSQGFNKLKKMIQMSDFLILNLDEFKSLRIKMDKLLKLVPQIIITKGKGGLDYFSKDVRIKRFEPFKVNRIVDSTGAGDCFVGAFIFALSRGNNIDLAINFAKVAAALSVTKRGARSMPTLREIEKYQK